MSKILANEIANYGDNAPIDLKEGLNIPAGKPIQAAGSAGTSGQVLTTTGSSVAWITPFDGDYGSLTNKPTIPAAQINSDWNASSGVAVINNKPSVPPLPSVTTETAGTAALTYNAGNGQFTFTPPDLSNYNTAYNWGDHSLAGYLTSLGDAAGVTTAKITNWDEAHGWGNHANGGYLTSYTETQTLDDVLTQGATTTQNITTTGKILYANNYDNLGDLPGANTYHGMFAHVHATGKGYFSHNGNWIELLDVSTSIGDLDGVDLTIAPTDGQVLKWEQSSSSWKAANDLTGGGGGGGLALTDLSASTATASGTGSLSYNNGTGAFTYTPPDLSGFLTSESDPVFTASPAAGVTTTGISNWNTAYSWGNHAGQGYLVGYGAVSNHTDVSITGAQNGQLLQYSGGNWTNFTPTYLTSYSETDTLDSVVGRGATTDKNITLTGAPSVPGRLDIQNNGSYAISLNASPGVGINTADGIGLSIGNIATNVWRATIDGATGAITGASFSTSGSLTAGSMTVGGLSYPTVNGTNGHVLTSDGAGNVSWQAQSGGGGGASVTISDTAPAASAGDLWWESDSGRLKIYYQDVDTSQWVDCNPPLTQDRIASSSAPSSATDNGTPGDIRYDSSYVYICISLNTWKRAALTTW
tara:strand:- start:5214 stop:7139 length:1926 start_codon:yes stop_codon:yes gene_type:complete